MEKLNKIHLPNNLLNDIHAHGEKTYPYEGAGLMLGKINDDERIVHKLLYLENAKALSEQHNRYLITPEDMLKAEKQASDLELQILGIFHSHPDHPALPSEFDREYAIPWYSYLITSVENGQSLTSRCWRLDDDRSAFQEELITT